MGLRVIPYTPEAYKLFHEGSIALAEVESNGIRIDIDYIDKSIIRTTKKIKRKKVALQETEVVKAWRKTFRAKTNLNSNDQLGKVLFDVLGHDCPALTKTGRYKTDEKTLSTLDILFVKDYLELSKLQKALGTYLKGIKRETQDGFLYPFYNLAHVISYRSSSDSPNFQNIPTRLPWVAKLIRRAFIARIGCHLIEIDVKGAEVRVAACYHKDPNMLSYIEDITKDMHRDMAMECFLLDQDEVSKGLRGTAKAAFVFAQFYGDYWLPCAGNIWADSYPFSTKSGVPIREHLKSQGITELGDQDPTTRPRAGTFEHHICKVEKRFWGKRFPVYARWKKKWYAEYQKKGWFKTKTGFICQGYMKKNEANNYPVQGSAFHGLLQALIWIQKELKRRKMKSLIIGQIHDSIIGDVPHEEVDEFLAICHKMFIKRLQKRWPWLIVPFIIEAEMTPMDGNWYEKKEVEIPA